MTHLRDDNKRLVELLWKHGGHSRYCKALEKGLTPQSAKLCDCGWGAVERELTIRDEPIDLTDRCGLMGEVREAMRQAKVERSR